MAERPGYMIVDIDLSTVFENKPLDGSSNYAATEIQAVYLTPRDASHAMIPPGSMFSVAFGDNPRLMLTESTTGYDFECGMLGGIKIFNEVALAGSVVRLLVVFSGPTAAGA